MSLRRWNPRPASMIWLEPRRVHAGAQDTFPGEDQVAQMLAEAPQGPTRWVVDDLWTPALLLRDFLELPRGPEARDTFFRWRYAQHLALEAPQSVQALQVDETAWLLLGMPQEIREAWLALGMRMGRPVHSLIPRWLWIYNQIAPGRTRPGMLLSLCEDERGTFTGTLAAWGRTLTLLRQWNEPASPETWMEERVNPTAAFLQRDTRPPQELLVWGAQDWPAGALEVRVLPAEIPAQEAS